MQLHRGDTIDGKYRIVELLGEGGMGAVYEGENVRIHRRVAIKVLHAAVAAKADAVQRFEREAQAAGRIGSEHIVEVLDLGDLAGGGRYIVMEFLEGESLGERIRRRGRLDPHEIAGTLYQLLEGLGAAHEAGIVHRDLKPDNVFLVGSLAGRRDFVKILDFGVSKFAPGVESDWSATRTGAVMGTPFYMSPEQARGQEVDARTDLYSAGVVAYQAVTGHVPFQAATFNELVFKIALESPEPAEVASPGLDAAFAALIQRAMSRDPAQRFQTAREMQAALARWASAAGAPLDRASGIFPIPAGTSGPTDAMALGLAKTLTPDERSDAPADGASPEPGKARGRSLGLGVAAVIALVVGAAGAHRYLGGVTQARARAAATASASVAAAAATAPAAEATAPVETAAPAQTATPVETATATATAEAPKKAPSKAAASASAPPRATATQPAGRRIGSDL
jgi:serine/threonine-protein kinase